MGAEVKQIHRDILHVDLDAFFAGVEQVCAPGLAGKPVVVCGDLSGRSVVSSASYEARARGVRAAMPLARARRLCPGAAFIRADFEKYRRFSSGFFCILGLFTPDVEPLSIDEAYLDLTGCGRFHGQVLDAADRIRTEIKRRLKLNASIGIGGSRIIARIASAFAKPNGILRVMHGEETAFLSPLPVSAIPGVGEKLNRRLIGLGVKTVGDLAAIEPELLALAFGARGEYLHLAANGRAPVPAARPLFRKSIRRESTFARDTADRTLIEAVLSRLVARACNSLREHDLRAGTLTVKLRYSDFATVTRSTPLSPPTDVDSAVFRTARCLLDRAYRRRLMLRLVGVSLAGLRDAAHQPGLFDEYSVNKYKYLYDAVDRIRERYDFSSIQSARSLQKPGKKRSKPKYIEIPNLNIETCSRLVQEFETSSNEQNQNA